VLLALVVGGLETEQFGGVVAAFLLGGVELGGQIINLGLPFSDDLVEVLAALLHLVGEELGAFNFDLHVLEFTAEALLDLLEGDGLLVEGLDGLLSLA